MEPAAGLSSKAAFITPTPRTLGCCHLSDGASAGAQSWPESSCHFPPRTPWVSLSLKTQWVGIFQILHSQTLLESLIKRPRRNPATLPTWVAEEALARRTQRATFKVPACPITHCAAWAQTTPFLSFSFYYFVIVFILQKG